MGMGFSFAARPAIFPPRVAESKFFGEWVYVLAEAPTLNITTTNAKIAAMYPCLMNGSVAGCVWFAYPLFDLFRWISV